MPRCANNANAAQNEIKLSQVLHLISKN
jgi:hypothetical protein